jgi:uncharacterized protein YcgL (UPF0745 family)
MELINLIVMLRKKLGNADKKTIRNNIQTNGFERLPK